MSLADPLWLLALLLIPLALVAQWRWRGRARRYAARFPAVSSVLAAVGARRGRWRQVIGLAAVLLAMAALGVALARPRESYRVPIGDASLMLVLDHSGSMAATDVAPSRIQAAIAAGNTLIGELPADVKVGFVGFGSTPDAVQQPVANHAVARSLLDSQQAGGGTATGPALQLALSLLHAARRGHPPSAIVLLSDGAANEGVDPTVVAAMARADHVQIDTVALGTPGGVLYEGPYGTISVPPDPALMAAIAADSGGRAFDAQTASKLSSIYKSLGDELGSVRRERDVTGWVLLAAAVLVLVALLVRVREVVAVA